MALITRKTSLSTTLAKKGEALRATEAAKYASANALVDAAADARVEASTAAVHADAVERAVAILEEAGVSL